MDYHSFEFFMVQETISPSSLAIYLAGTGDINNISQKIFVVKFTTGINKVEYVYSEQTYFEREK
jgi:hypothetical protein